MSVRLNQPIDAKVLRHAKIVNFTLEDNVARYVIVYVAFGEMIDDFFVEWVDPTTGVKCEPKRFKIEDGIHPQQENRSLRRCPDCGKWFGLESICDSCGAATDPYDGLTRLALDGLDRINVRRIARFLMREVVPDPVTGQVGKLLDAEG